MTNTLEYVHPFGYDNRRLSKPMEAFLSQQLSTTLDATLTFGALSDKARAYANDARSANTVRAYESDLQAFRSWCQLRGVTGLPATAETLSLYVADIAECVKPATLQRRLAAIAVAHKAAGYESPTSHEVVRSVLAGTRRRLGVAQAQKTALTVADVRAMVADLGDAPIDLRDRALLLLGFAGALRRSELVALDVADIRFERAGVVLTLARSKTDQEGATEEIAVPYGSDLSTCPVRALQTWMDCVEDGPLFRNIARGGRIGDRLSAHAVALVVKKLAGKVGLDTDKLAGHSLRSGFATSAARAGKSEAAIMRQTRHKSVTVARRYIRQGTKWDDHAGFGIGL
ncbi:MAG TPA: tyrosine-type recombinase/integrase [Candidatus Cybelea sp.]|nr:tyrosine-type recombinase/integrase [Candidatus Cybelea sp.]